MEINCCTRRNCWHFCVVSSSALSVNKHFSDSFKIQIVWNETYGFIFTKLTIPLDFRLEGDSYVHYKAMLISFSLHLILLMFELLACDKLTSDRPMWVIVFIPIIFGSVASVGACVWSVKHDRSFELELFMAVNALQFVFLPLKLDKLVTWSWEVVFVPLWIVLCLSLVGE